MGARETTAALERSGVRLVVISGTLDLLLDTLFPEHPFDMDGKAVALRSVAARERIPLGRCAFVGDHTNDLSAFRITGLAVAFNPKDPALEAAAGAVVRSDDLRDVLPCLIET